MPDRAGALNDRLAKLYALADWPLRIAGLNLIWIVGVLAGGIVLGLAPASVAVAAVHADLLNGKRSSLWQNFWRHWRVNFGRSQLSLGLPLATVWVFWFYSRALGENPLGLALLIVGGCYAATILWIPAAVALTSGAAPVIWRTWMMIISRRPLVTLGVGAFTLIVTIATTLFVPVALPILLPSLPLLAVSRMLPEQS